MLTPLGPDIHVSRVPYRKLGITLTRQLVVVCLPGGGLWIDSPIPWTPALRATLARIGKVCHVIGPNRQHDECLKEFQAECPAASFHAAPGLAAQRRDVRFVPTPLSDTAHPDWQGVLDQHLVRGMPLLNEVVFLHRASRSLILADLAFNLGPHDGWAINVLLKLDGTSGRFAPSRACRLLMRDRPRCAPPSITSSHGTSIGLSSATAATSTPMGRPHFAQRSLSCDRGSAQRGSSPVSTRYPLRATHYFSPPMRFHKYHALGNDYIVLDPRDFPAWKPAPTVDQIRVVCHRNFGVGSDGILWGPLPSKQSEFGLRIFNPDGSEAEKSGNGLRIFSRYLWDQGLVKNPTFTVETPGGHVQSVIKESGRLITVAMGSVSFDSAQIPVNLPGAPRDVLNEKIKILDREFTYCAATIGNPHCVIPLAEVTPELAHKYGPHLETHANFPRKTNVQFLQVLDRANIRIEIWERGAGYTLASGSSSSASAAVAHKLGLVDRSVTVHMPGGKIGIEIRDGFSIMMTGTVNKVAEGAMHQELFAVKV